MISGFIAEGHVADICGRQAKKDPAEAVNYSVGFIKRKLEARAADTPLPELATRS